MFIYFLVINCWSCWPDRPLFLTEAAFQNHVDEPQGSEQDSYDARLIRVTLTFCLTLRKFRRRASAALRKVGRSHFFGLRANLRERLMPFISVWSPPAGYDHPGADEHHCSDTFPSPLKIGERNPAVR